MLKTKLIPAAEKGSHRLLVVLHGLGDSMDGWSWLPDELRLPWLNYLLVNAPDDYHGGYSWYDLPGDSGPGIRRSRELLFQLLDAQRAAGFASEQTAVLGFSQGCLMTFDTGFRYPHPLAALVGISGYIWQPEKLLAELSPVAKQQKALFTHGTRDPLIPIAPVRAQVEQLRSAGLDLGWREFEKVHTVAGEPELAVIRSFLTGAFAR
ncbi:MAG TPA: serine esterase [Candidatus Limnocylindria bacterium]|jgi:phospholipase/carboxylesterase|nr:serine esterase [Candidatus Limnocylindria bacterium]